MRFLLVCGGTGGHFYPGFVLGKELRRRGHEVLFVVRDGDPARARLEAEDFPYSEIRLRGLPRRPSLSWFTLPFQLLAALRTARRIVRAYRPAAVAATGGYLTLPLAWAARRAGVPRVLHESNALLGLANRLSAKGATLALGLPLTAPAGVRTVLTGTPVREALWKPGDAAAARRTFGLAEDKETLLVFGGSQGARALNAKIPTFLAEADAGFQVLHVTGKNVAGDPAAVYAGAGIAAKVLSYCERMDLAYAAADIVICRCGAGTVAELAALRKPALVVPFPHAADDHQAANGAVLADAGAARMLREENLKPKRLAAELALMRKNRARMAAAYDLLMLPPAEKSGIALADIVEEAAKGYLRAYPNNSAPVEDSSP